MQSEYFFPTLFPIMILFSYMCVMETALFITELEIQECEKHDLSYLVPDFQSPPGGEWEQMVHREKDAAGKPLAHQLIEGNMYCLFALGRSCLNGL